ncbi:MAG TPA: M48 family metalloprotease [Aquabacterium sp.]|mgnify:CR=1 FL=1|nr:M48 family metalloprotease [Aquabacterium sp.]HQC97789.1 M48 family metalloprotease [Aquabacterium sp.]
MPRPLPLLVRPWRQRLPCAAVAALLLAGSVAPAWSQAAAPAPGTPPAPLRLPGLGESASDEFNLNQEKRIGEQIMREVRRDPAYLDDPLLLDYLQSLWAPLVRTARAQGDIDADTERLFPYESFLVRDRSVNAFALPGGYVGVHLGLIAITGTPDELASVLAHELAHVTRRHIARSVAASSRASTLGLAGMLLGLLVASRAANADMAQAAIMGGQAAMAQAQLNFSRDMEREADRNGLATMTGAGFAPAGMPAMFGRLDGASRLNDSGNYPYLRSHPLTVERIGEARQLVQAAGAASAPPPAPLLHLLMQARARALMDPSSQALRRLQDFDARATMTQLPLPDRLAGLYAAALASAALRDFDRADRAQQAASALLAASPLSGDAAARRMLDAQGVQLALARGDAAQAARLIDAGQLVDGSRSGLLLQADWALADGSVPVLRRSAEALQTWVTVQREDAAAWQALALAAGRLGQPLRAVRAEAEVQAALGNLGGAMDRLRAGQQLARRGGPGTDFIEASVIDARLRALQAQRRQLQADERKAGERPRGDAPE